MISTRRNLLSHLLRLANMRLASAAPECAAVDDPFGQGDAYMDALQHIAELLDPSFRPTELTTLDSRRAVLKRVEELWLEVVIGEADPASAKKACDYAHKLLSRFPEATASYVNECANAFAEPQIALDLLAQASRLIQNAEDAFRVDRAQKHAVQVILRRKLSIPAETIPPAPALQTAIAAAAAPVQPFFTEGHRDALKRLTEMGELFYDRPSTGAHVALRLFPLVVAPTGAGKSHLIRKVAESLRADYVKITRGDWCPRGAKTGRPTTFLILDHVLKGDRVCLHLDECDKWNLDFTKEWSAGIGSDLWNTLDCHFPIEDYLAETKFEDKPKPAADEVDRRVKAQLWIVGSGTWQNVFESGGKAASLGFCPSPLNGQVSVDAIRRAGAISPELMLRFNSDLIFMSYPTREETPGLLHSAGITAMADELGVTLKPDEIDWQRGGMRVLETIATRLAIEKHRRTKKLA